MLRKFLSAALIALAAFATGPFLIATAAAQETTTGGGDAGVADQIVPRAFGHLLVSPANVGILGNYFQVEMQAFLTANGHTVSIESAASIQGGSLGGLDVLYVNRSGISDAATVVGEIEAFVAGGGILITEFDATKQLFDGTFGFFDTATLDDDFFVPSGTVCGGNTVNIVSPGNAVATGLPGQFSCSGDPIGVLKLYDAATLDPDVEIVATIDQSDGNLDGVEDAVVGTSCIGLGTVVAYFSDFGDFQPLQQPRVCPFPSCNRSIEDETLMLNSVEFALENCTIEAMIDIKFLSNPNAFNCKKQGVLPVTIFGTDDVDVAEIDISSLRLSLASNGVFVGPPRSWSFADRGDPDTDKGASQGAIVNGVEQDYLNPDGLLDLDVGFEAPAVAGLIGCDALEKNDVSETLVLTGMLNNGRDLASVPVGDPGIDQLVIKNK
jgi:hypothetical protein